eukprot:TCONS_00014697-protein
MLFSPALMAKRFIKRKSASTSTAIESEEKERNTPSPHNLQVPSDCRRRAHTFDEKNQNTFGSALFIRKQKAERIHSYKTFRISVLGSCQVGKSTIIKCFLGQLFEDYYNPTISCEVFEAGIFLEIENKLKQFDLVFHDFRGDFHTNNPLQYRDELTHSQGFILVHTKNELQSFPQVLEMLSDIRKVKGDNFTSILIMENKCDELCYYGDKRNNRRSFDMDGCLNSAVSAKQNKNVTEAIGSLVENIEMTQS